MRARVAPDVDGALDEGPVRAVLVVVLDILAEHGFEVTSSKDERAVEALAPYGAHDALGDGVRPRRPGRVLMILMPFARIRRRRKR